MGDFIRVFISYSHDSPRHSSRVLELANRLRREGVEAWIDQFDPHPAEGWQRWMQKQIERADFILMVCTPTYCHRFEGKEPSGRGRGVSWEGQLLNQLIYEASGRNDRVIPVTFDAEDEAAILLAMRSYARYTLPDGYEQLYRRLTNQPEVRPARLSDVVQLPALAALEPRSTGMTDRLVGVPELPSHFVPRPDKVDEIVRALLGEGGKVGITAVGGKHAIHGMGGIGKTVLATAVARELAGQFADGVVWLTVGQEPSLTALQAEMGRAVGDRDVFENPRQGRAKLAELYADRAVLLVLDDVWDVEHLRALDVVSAQGRLLVTTRDRRILADLKGAAEHHLDVLPPEQALALLASWTRMAADALPEAAELVADACGRLPLALAMIRAMVRADEVAWTDALELLQSADLDEIAHRFADYPYPDMLRSLEVSVRALDPDLRARYRELAVFPEDAAISQLAIQTLWGLSWVKTRRRIGKLNARSLLSRDQDGNVRLHDVQRMYVLHETADVAPLHNKLVDGYAAQCAEGLAGGPGVEDGYFYRWLPYHLVNAGRIDQLQSLLADYTWLYGKLRAVGIAELMADFELVAGDEELQLVCGALRLSSHVLGHDPQQLPSQLIGRLGAFERAPNEPLAPLLAQCRGPHPHAWIEPLTPSLMPPGGPLRCTLSGHTETVIDVAVSADGKRAISASLDNTLRLWELESGKELVTLSSREHAITAVVLTPDGRRAVSAFSDLSITVWDLESGQELVTLGSHQDKITTLTVTGDGKRVISASSDGTLKVWDLEGEREPYALVGHAGRITAAAVTENGKRVISASFDKTLKVWDLESGQELRTLIGHAGRITAVAVTEDGKRVVSASSDKAIRIWDLESGHALRTISGTMGRVTAMAVTGDGKRAISAAWDKTALKVWSLESGQELGTLYGHAGWISAVAVTKDGSRVISASSDETLKVWDLEGVLKPPNLPGHAGRVSAVAMIDDGKRIISASSDRTLKVWDSNSGRELRTLSGHIGWVNAVTVTGDGKHAISASSDRTLKVWDSDSCRELRTLSDHRGRVTAVAVTKDGKRLISASSDGILKLRDLNISHKLRALDGHVGKVTAVAITTDGKHAISAATDKTLKVWELDNCQELCTLSSHTKRVNALAVTGDGRRAISAS